MLLGYIRDEICGKKGLPLLTAIVVNKRTKLPGESFLPEGTVNLSEKEYKEKFHKLKVEVFTCNKWDALLKELELTPIR
jgi:hypothetical protein